MSRFYTKTFLLRFVGQEVVWGNSTIEVDPKMNIKSPKEAGLDKKLAYFMPTLKKKRTLTSVSHD